MDKLDELGCLSLETGAQPAVTVIWLHGLGAGAEDFVSVVPALGLSGEPALRFVFPQAPTMPVTLYGGQHLPAWYDILQATRTARQIDEGSLLLARERLRRLIAREETRGITSARIFLAGFSQGGAVAYFTALTHPEPLAGVLALSTYLPATDRLTAEFLPHHVDLPVLVAHGLQDDVVSPELGSQAVDWLVTRGCHPDWRTYAMAHTVSVSEIRDIGRWLRSRLSDLVMSGSRLR